MLNLVWIAGHFLRFVLYPLPIRRNEVEYATAAIFTRCSLRAQILSTGKFSANCLGYMMHPTNNAGFCMIDRRARCPADDPHEERCLVVRHSAGRRTDGEKSVMQRRPHNKEYAYESWSQMLLRQPRSTDEINARCKAASAIQCMHLRPRCAVARVICFSRQSQRAVQRMARPQYILAPSGDWCWPHHCGATGAGESHATQQQQQCIRVWFMEFNTLFPFVLRLRANMPSVDWTISNRQ